MSYIYSNHIVIHSLILPLKLVNRCFRHFFVLGNKKRIRKRLESEIVATKRKCSE